VRERRHSLDKVNAMSRPLLLLLQSMSLILLLGACAAGQRGAPPPPPAAGIMADEYLIGVDDMVSVRVWRNPDLDVTVPVRPDGNISVPLIGDVRAGGRTPQAISASIEEALAAYVREPKVAVILTDLRSHEYISRVRVTGAVRTPVSLPYRQGMTVLDAVLAAGGPTEFAAKNRTSLHRKNGHGAESFAVPLGAILDRGDLTANHTVQPGDVITVPERLF
jgi:polysaccharide biosynthesis/export protein